MSITTSCCEQFLQQETPIFDVRSPGEWAQGKIPGAINLPLLSNEERVLVGTTYKQSSPQEALLQGLALASGKFAGFVRQVLALAPEKKIRLYCWRGGMRSQFVASLMKLASCHVMLLEGGYKSFRRHCLDTLAKNYSLKVLGGKTGVGKTEVLKELQRMGEQVVDLECIANHRGSVFGHIGIEGGQPSCEQFENLIAVALDAMDPKRPIWIEDESLHIGRCRLPHHLYQQMRHAPLYIVEAEKPSRLAMVEQVYSKEGLHALAEPVEKLHKRLGYERTQLILSAIQKEDLRIFDWLLEYYDRAYEEMLRRRKRTVEKVVVHTTSYEETASQLLHHQLASV